MKKATEFERIQQFLSHFPASRARVGPGDDCAVVKGSLDDSCLTTDAIVEDVHFSLSHFSFEDIGHKALAVNLSDIAAMGATPTWFVCALGWPERLPPSALKGVAKGMARLARRYGVDLVGGNFTSSPVLSVTVTMAGKVPAGKALLRRGARAGDVIYVSGELGMARWGLEGMRGKMKASRAAWNAQKRPMPRVELGLLARRYARACLDVSDGFAQDLGHLCEASNVGACIELSQLPVRAELKRMLGEHAFEFAAQGGEDYELIFAVPKSKAAAFVREAAKREQKVTQVGEFEGKALRWSLGGKSVPAPRGFDHFISMRAKMVESEALRLLPGERS